MKQQAGLTATPCSQASMFTHVLTALRSCSVIASFTLTCLSVMCRAFGLPMGLGLIIIAGAELLTANSCYLSAAVFEVRKQTCLHLLCDYTSHKQKNTNSHCVD